MSNDLEFQKAAKAALNVLLASISVKKYIQNQINEYEYIEKKTDEYERAKQNAIRTYQIPNVPTLVDFVWEKDSKAHWKPYLKSLRRAGGHTGIIIPKAHISIRTDKPRVVVASPWANDIHILTTHDSIELIASPKGRLSAPAGMDGKDRMIIEFDDLSYFITYLEEEMAKGNYPSHLSSDWR